MAIRVDDDTNKDWIEADVGSTFTCEVDNIKPPDDLRWKVDGVPLDPQPDTSSQWQTDSSYRLISSFTRTFSADRMNITVSCELDNGQAHTDIPIYCELVLHPTFVYAPYLFILNN